MVMNASLFAATEPKRKISSHDYKQRSWELREALIEAQQTLRQHGNFPVLALFSGMETAGKGETLNLLNEWMDPRWLVTRAYGRPSEEERQRPGFWRFWRDLPPRGRIGLFLGAWYYHPLTSYSFGRINSARLQQQLEKINLFEAMLAADGAVVIKFWFHLSREHQLKRLRQLSEDPLERWRVGVADWEQWHHHNEFIAAGQQIIHGTSHDHAPWHVIAGWDERHRNLAVADLLQAALQQHLRPPSRRRRTARTGPAPSLPELPLGSPLRQLDLGQKVGAARYRHALREQQAALNHWHRLAAERRISTVVVFEGPDAAGKGGAIRRVTAALEAPLYRVHPTAAPTDEELAHHYLWRFWRHLERAGRVTIYDRSWYGRVLVERVEGLASADEWWRAYDEINEFEAELVHHGIVLVKFWLQIDKSEQLKRFRNRENTPHKRWKLTADDWRNRNKWDQYELAAHDMLERTSTEHAPWFLIAANDKRFARIEVLGTLCRRLENALQP